MSFARASTIAFVLAFIVAACGTSRHSAGTAVEGTAAAWHQLVLCARAHGMPSLPDPTIDADGRPHFAGSTRTIPAQTRRACQAMYDRLAPSSVNGSPTRAQLEGLLGFARCMRSHAVSDWPDPRPDGNFALDTRLQHLLKSAIRAPLMACERFNPDPRGRIYSTRG